MKQIFSPFILDNPDMEFLNYWNMKQVIYLKGKFDLSMSLDELHSKLNRLDLIPKILISNANVPLQNFKILEGEDLKREQQNLLNRNSKYNELMKQLIIPAKFSILSIISSGKVSIFENTLIYFIKFLLDKTFEGFNIFKAS